jgi:hypothetical protein
MLTNKFSRFHYLHEKKVCTSCWKLIVFSTKIAELDVFVENFNVDKNFERYYTDWSYNEFHGFRLLLVSQFFWVNYALIRSELYFLKQLGQ